MRRKSKGSIFQQLDKPKLVSYCRDNDNYEQYILQEFQLYRIYQLLTPVSHRARLLRLTYADSASGQVKSRRYGFVIEEPKAIAARLGGKFVEQTGAGASDLDPDQDALLGVFQYMIGNTDWAVSALHNIVLIRDSTGVVYPVPYDFDWSGVIWPPYAQPDPSLNIRTVRQRTFRAACRTPDELGGQAVDRVLGLARPVDDRGGDGAPIATHEARGRLVDNHDSRTR